VGPAHYPGPITGYPVRVGLSNPRRIQENLAYTPWTVRVTLPVRATPTTNDQPPRPTFERPAGLSGSVSAEVSGSGQLVAAVVACGRLGSRRRSAAGRAVPACCLGSARVLVCVTNSVRVVWSSRCCSVSADNVS
jgi:hypothetical protein